MTVEPKRLSFRRQKALFPLAQSLTFPRPSICTVCQTSFQIRLSGSSFFIRPQAKLLLPKQRQLLDPLTLLPSCCESFITLRCPRKTIASALVILDQVPVRSDHQNCRRRSSCQRADRVRDFHDLFSSPTTGSSAAKISLGGGGGGGGARIHFVSIEPAVVWRCQRATVTPGAM